MSRHKGDEFMKSDLNLLVIEDAEADFMLIKRCLKQSGHNASYTWIKKPEDIDEALGSHDFDAVLLDYNVPGINFRESLKTIKTRYPDLPLILVSGSVGEEEAVELLKTGVWDFVLKDNLVRLAPAIERSLGEAEERKARLKAEKELRESESRFFTVFECSPLGIVITRPENGEVIAVNDAMLRIIEYDKEEVIGRQTTDLNIWAKNEDRTRMIESLRSNGRVENFEASCRKKNGEICDLMFSAKMIELAGLTFILAMVSDITERKFSEKMNDLHFHLLEIVNRNNGMDELLREFVSEIRNFTGCDSVGIRVLDDEGNIPYQAYDGFSNRFFLIESPLSVKSDHCMCINVIKGETNPDLPFYTKGGSFYMNGTSHFLATVPEEEKGITRNACNAEGYESVALVPFRSADRILGLIHVADRRNNMANFKMVEMLEKAAMQLGTAFQRAHAEATLRESESRYHSLFDNMLEGFAYCRMIFEQDVPADFIYISVNNAFETLTGLHDVIGKYVTDVIPGIKDSNPDIFEIYGKVASTGISQRFETYVGALDNWFSVAVYSPAKDHFVAVFDIITERKKAEIALMEQKKKYKELFQEFKTLLDNVPDGIALLSPDLKIKWANKNLADKAKNSKIDLLSDMKCHEELWGHRQQCDECPAAKSFKSSKIEETCFETPDKRTMELRAIPIADEFGRVESVIEIIRDITEQRRLEQQLRQAQKMESIGTLAGGIAHDFNNILTAIVGYGNLILMDMAEDDPHRANVEIILEAADRAAHLTRDLLLFSRKQVSNICSASINEIIRTVEKFLRRVIGEDIELKTKYSVPPLIVLADAHQIEQVLMNFGTNARDAMPSGGSFSITVEKVELDSSFISAHGYGSPGVYARVAVSDTGKGMDEETRQKIFEPFFTTKERGKGTGLGLAVVYGIIKQHNGYINVYSEPDLGTTFIIYLPATTLEKSESRKANSDEPPAGGTETLLLAEDDESLRKLYSRILRRSGYTVIEAVDGEDAIRKFSENKDSIKLLLFDVIMPKVSGKNAYDKILEINPDIKCIFASGYAADFIQQKQGIGNRMPIIYKPVSPDVYLKTVRAVLDE